MVQMYTIAGRQFGSHQLAIATLSLLFGGSAYAMRGPSKAEAQKGPPINASSKEEENFVKSFISKNGDEEKAKH